MKRPLFEAVASFQSKLSEIEGRCETPKKIRTAKVQVYLDLHYIVYKAIVIYCSYCVQYNYILSMMYC